MAQPRPRASGGEEQVQPACGEGDHREEQRQLPGELVASGQDRDGAVVGGHHPDDMAHHHRDDLEVGDQRLLVDQEVLDAQIAGAEVVAAVAKRNESGTSPTHNHT